MFIETLKDNLKKLVPSLAEKIDKLENPWDALMILDKLDVKEEIEGVIEAGVIIEGNVFLGKNSIVKAPARLEGNIIIGEDVIVGPYAFIRGGVIIGNNCRIGSTEVKHSVILDNSNAGHFNYVGDSIIGQHCNLGAGTKLANFRFDKNEIFIRKDGERIPSGTNKFGVVLENNVQTVCNKVLMPGSYIKEGTNVIDDK